MLLDTIGKSGNDKRDIQPVLLTNFENDVITFPNTVTDSVTNPISDKKQQSHDNKQHISSKEKGNTNSILVTDSVNVTKQDHKQQSRTLRKR